jgi:hypothetical protein
LIVANIINAVSDVGKFGRSTFRLSCDFSRCHDGKSSFFHSLTKETALDLLSLFIIGTRRIATFMPHRSLVVRMRIEKSRELYRIEENGREKNAESDLIRDFARALANFRRYLLEHVFPLAHLFHANRQLTRRQREESYPEMYGERNVHISSVMQDPTMDRKPIQDA